MYHMAQNFDLSRQNDKLVSANSFAAIEKHNKVVDLELNWDRNERTVVMILINFIHSLLVNEGENMEHRLVVMVMEALEQTMDTLIVLNSSVGLEYMMSLVLY